MTPFVTVLHDKAKKRWTWNGTFYDKQKAIDWVDAQKNSSNKHGTYAVLSGAGMDIKDIHRTKIVSEPTALKYKIYQKTAN